MQYNNHDKTLALAGIFQAARLVQQVARSGMVDQEVFAASIKSIFKIDAATPEDVFGGVNNVISGCKTLLNQLGAGDPVNPAKDKDIEVTKYVINIMILERKLMKEPQLLKKITAGIEKAQSQSEHFSITHDNVIASLANVYSETISTLRPRVMVNGEHNHLSNPDNANKIRALLLAAIRSAVLWDQCGGSRWQIMFKRKVFSGEADKILNANPRTLH
ncbi:MAG: high frequency lysogenization protein HflD [Gammaproteobacteria bacterium]